MASLWLERGDIEDDGSIVFRDASKWIPTNKPISELDEIATRWARRGPEYMASVLMEDARGNSALIVRVAGADDGGIKSWASEIYHALDHASAREGSSGH